MQEVRVQEVEGNKTQEFDAYLDGKTLDDLPKARKMVKEHHKDQIIGSPSKAVTTRSSNKHMCLRNVFVLCFSILKRFLK